MTRIRWWRSTRRPSRQSTPSPSRAAGKRLRRLWIEPLEDRVLLDSGPSITAYTPQEIRNAVFDHIDLTFSEAIDASTFTVDDVAISGPAGPVIASEIDALDTTNFR